MEDGSTVTCPSSLMNWQQVGSRVEPVQQVKFTHQLFLCLRKYSLVLQQSKQRRLISEVFGSPTEEKSFQLPKSFKIAFLKQTVSHFGTKKNCDLKIKLPTTDKVQNHNSKQAVASTYTEKNKQRLYISACSRKDPSQFILTFPKHLAQIEDEAVKRTNICKYHKIMYFFRISQNKTQSDHQTHLEHRCPRCALSHMWRNTCAGFCLLKMISCRGTTRNNSSS